MRSASTRFTVHVEIDPAPPGRESAAATVRSPRTRQSFHALHEQRSPLYDEVAQRPRQNNVDEIVLAAAGIEVENGLLDAAGPSWLRAASSEALVADATCSGFTGRSL